MNNNNNAALLLDVLLSGGIYKKDNISIFLNLDTKSFVIDYQMRQVDLKQTNSYLCSLNANPLQFLCNLAESLTEEEIKHLTIQQALRSKEAQQIFADVIQKVIKERPQPPTCVE